MPDEIEDAIRCAAVDREPRGIVLRRTGRAFSAGFDFGGGFHHREDQISTDG
jgi:enoyl-CoA hydratase/carnithine racemase